MHNCQDEDVVLLDCVENAVGKSARHASAQVILNSPMASRRLSNPTNRILDRINKSLCNLNPLPCIVLNCLSIFGERFRMK